MNIYQSKHIIKGLISTLILSFILSIFCLIDAYALTTKISFSDPSTTSGEEFNVRMKITSTDGTGIERADIMLSYDANYIEFVSGTAAEGGAGSVRLSSLDNAGATEWVYELKFKALQAGNTKLEVSTWEIYDNDVKMATLEKQGSSAITITGASAATSGTGLSSLSVSTGELNPTFSTDVKEYTLNVGEETSSIEVNAVALDTSATVNVSGNTELVSGSNTVQIDVVARDGSTSTYTIKVNKGEVIASAQEISSTVQVGGKSYTVVETFDDALIPGGFSAIEYNYKGKIVKAARAVDRELLLIYLLSDDATGDLFVYDEATDTWSPYAELTVSAKTLTIVPLGSEIQVPAGLVESSIELNGKAIKGWIFENDTNMESCVVYAMNANGEKNFYRYDLKEKTVQRYFESYASTSADMTADTDLAIINNNLRAENSTSQRMIKILYGVIAALALGLLFALVYIVSRKDKREKISKDRDMNESEDKRSVRDEFASSAVGYETKKSLKTNQKEDFANSSELEVDFVDIDELEEDFLSIDELEDSYIDFEELEELKEIPKKSEVGKAVQTEVKKEDKPGEVEEKSDFDDDFEELDI